MSARRSVSRRWHLIRVAALACTALLVALAVVIVRQGAADAAKYASVIAALTSLAAFATPLGERIVTRLAGGGRDAGQPTDSAVLDQAADRMAAAVQAQWRAEARTRRLQDPWPLPVRWVATGREVADHDDLVFARPAPDAPVAVHRPELAGELADATDAFESLPHRRLVVLGCPGAGKSVFAMAFALAMLRRRAAGGAVPVLFPVAGWNPELSGLHHWMIEYITANYHLSTGDIHQTRRIAQELVRAGKILPVLDGLDEIPYRWRPLAVEELNRSLDDGTPVVVTCRTDEFDDAIARGDVITRAAVVELQPLDLPTAIAYLRETTPAGRRADRWEPVFARLRAHPDASPAVVLRTPLMVALARTIYGDSPADPRELLDDAYLDAGTLEGHLLDRLIPATYQEHARAGEGDGTPWRATEVTGWLTFLARNAGGAGRPDLAWWQLELAVPAALHQGITGLLGGAVVGLVFGVVPGALLAAGALAFGLVSPARPPTLEGWLTGRLEPWLRRWAGDRFAGSLMSDKEPVERRLVLALSRFAAVCAGLTAGLGSLRDSGLRPSVAWGVAVALAVGMVLGHFTVAPRVTPSEVQFDARRGLRRFGRHLAVGLCAGVGSGLLVMVLVNSLFGIAVGLSVGLATGLIDGLNTWLDVPADVTQALSPQSTRRAERTAALARAGTVALAVGLAAGTAYLLAYGWRSGLTHGLVFGAGFGIADRYSGISQTVWGRYVAAKVWLAMAGRLPWRLTAFLEDAHRHGLLRQAGAAYQFRHLRLQQRLAGDAPRAAVV